MNLCKKFCKFPPSCLIIYSPLQKWLNIYHRSKSLLHSVLMNLWIYKSALKLQKNLMNLCKKFCEFPPSCLIINSPLQKWLNIYNRSKFLLYSVLMNLSSPDWPFVKSSGISEDTLRRRRKLIISFKSDSKWVWRERVY